ARVALCRAAMASFRRSRICRPQASAAATKSGYRNTFMNRSRRQNALIDSIRAEDTQFLLHQRLFRGGGQQGTIMAPGSGDLQAVIASERDGKTVERRRKHHRLKPPRAIPGGERNARRG